MTGRYVFTLRWYKCARLMRQLLRQLCHACNLIVSLQADELHLEISMKIRRSKNFEVLKVHIVIFGAMTPCYLVGGYRSSGDIYI